MWLPSIPRLRRLRSRRARPATKPSRRLLVELLEDRTLPSFLTPASYPVGSYPDAVAVGDFAGTGITDLVVANHGIIPSTVSVLLGKGDGTFGPAQNYAVGGAPVSVAVGDLNGDGKIDIITANDNGTVSVLLGKGDGTFQSDLNFALPTEGGLTQTPLSLAVGDFNKDGKLDVVVTAHAVYSGYYTSTDNGYVNVLIGNGAGGFSADNVYALGAVDPPSVAVADFNGDGNLDLAVNEGSAVGVMLGNGNGTFQSAQNYAVRAGWGYAVAAADFNGDGKIDLATANGNNSVNVLLGKGNGTFQPAVSYTVGGSAASLAVADFNLDGKLDIVTANRLEANGASPGSVSVLLGKGDGTFQSTENFDTGLTPSEVVVGDFNRDGQPDVAVVNPSAGTVSVLLNTGDWHTVTASGFPASITAGMAGSLTVTAENPDGSTATNYTGTVHFTSSDPQAVLPSDYTFTPADAGVHTFSATLKTAGAQSITVTMAGTAFRGPSLGTTVNPASASHFRFAAPSDVSTGSAFSATITALDPYGNVATGYTGTVQITSSDTRAVLPAPYRFTTGSGGDNGVHTFGNGFTLNTAGSQSITATDKAASSITGSAPITVVNPFLPPVSYAVGKSPGSVAVADFNGDGNLDLVMANGDGTVSVLLGKPDGTFQPAQNYAVTAGSLAVGDFNGDGKLDIVTSNGGNGSVSVLLGKGDGTFQPAINYSLPTEAGLMQIPLSLAVGDFNKDGKLDVVVTAQTYLPGTYSTYPTYTGYINVLIGNGAGGVSADNVQPFFDPFASSVAVGDFNGDGNPDLAVAASGQNYVNVLLGIGDGTFGPASYVPVGNGPNSVAVGDFNGDGKLDFVTANVLSNTVSLVLGNGNGSFAPATTYATGPGPQSVTVADFNRDGKLDIVTANANANGSVSVLLGDGNGTFGSALNYASGGANPESVAVGDFYPDGYPDLVVANTASNMVSVLLNPAEGLAHGFTVTGFPSPATTGTAGNFTVMVENADGTTDTNYTSTVHFTSSDPQAVLPADYTFTAEDMGTHTFPGGATLFDTNPMAILTATDTSDCTLQGALTLSVQ
jgi:hypothetical protein